MTDDVFYKCEGCGKRIDPNAPDTVKAVQVIRIVTMGPAVSEADGMGALFHVNCYDPFDPDYRRTDL